MEIVDPNDRTTGAYQLPDTLQDVPVGVIDALGGIGPVHAQEHPVHREGLAQERQQGLL